MKSKRKRSAVGFIVFAAVLTVASILSASAATPALAHQPDGAGPSHNELANPPCPHGHEDICERITEYGTSHNSAVTRYVVANGESVIRQEIRFANHIREQAARYTFDNENGLGGNVANEAITSGISSLPWLVDGANTPTERTTLELLDLTQDLNPTLVNRLVTQPFMQDHTPGDQEAMFTLYRMSRDYPEWTNLISGMGRFGDADGITNSDAKLLAVMSLPYANEDYRTLWNLVFNGTVQEQNHIGRFGNTVNVAIVRERQPSAANAAKMMQFTTTAIAHNEELMNTALPTNFVGMLLADYPGAAGANNSWSIQIDSDAEWLWTDRSVRKVIAHEVSHYWWNGNSAWLNEGAASYAAAYSQWRATNANDVYTSTYPCPFYRTIEHLVADAPDYRDSEGRLCNYSLGERLFIHLDRATTSADFEQRFQNLYRMTQNPQYENLSDGELLLAAYCPDCAGRKTIRGVSEMGRAIARHFGEKIFTKQSPINGVVPGLGLPGAAVSLVNYSWTNRQYGLATLASSSQDQRRWIRIPFPNATGVDRKETVNVLVEHYYEETEPWWAGTKRGHVTVNDGYGRLVVFLDQAENRALGHHWVYVYDQQGRKLAELQYQVVP